MSHNIDDDDNNDKDSKMFSDGFPEEREMKNRDKILEDIQSGRNAQRGFLKRCEEVLNVISGLFKGLMK